MARVLIIDDEGALRAMLCRLFADGGHEAVEAFDGREAIRLHRERPADLIITDIFMPEKDGLETIQELRRDDPGAKIIAISSGGYKKNLSFLDYAREFGALRTFQKPFDMRKLMETVKEILEES